MDAAASTVAGITGSRKRNYWGLARGKRAAAADAAAFITLVTTIVTIAIDFPSSPMIVTVSADIVASSSLTFTDDEITSLTAVEETLTAAVELVTMHSRRPRPLWRTPPAPLSLRPVSPL